MEDIVETSSGLMWARPSAALHSSGGHAHLSEVGTPSYSNPGSESSLSWGELINTYLCIRLKGTTHVTSTEPHIHLGEPTSGFPHFTWPLHFICQNQKNRHQSHCLSLSAYWIFRVHWRSTFNMLPTDGSKRVERLYKPNMQQAWGLTGP